MSESKEYVEGVKLVIGRLKGESTTTVQSVLFDRETWSKQDAAAWLRDHDFKTRFGGKGADETESNFRYRQRDPGDFEDDSFRTIEAGAKQNSVSEFAVAGVTLIAGKLRDKDVQQIYGVKFDKASGWDLMDAYMWLCQNGLHNKYGDAHVPSYNLGNLKFRDEDDAITVILMPAEMFEGEFTEMPVTSESARRFAEDGVLEYGAGDKKTRRRARMEEDELYSIDGVEIFRTGRWKGDTYNTRDLDDIVDAFDKAGFQPPIKLGHAEKSGDPAFGWVKSLRREGDRLIADFRDIPAKLFEAIKRRAYDSVSSEIFWNFERGGKKFRRALKAVALLGAEIPAVADLKPIRESLASALSLGDAEYEKLATCAIGVDDVTNSTIQDLNAEVERLAAEKADLAQKLEAADASSDEATKLSEDLAAKEAEVEAARKEFTDALAAKDAEIAKLKKDNESFEARMSRLEEERLASLERERQSMIDGKVSKLSIPALREPLRHLYDMATRDTSDEAKFEYSIADSKTVELSGVEVVDKLVEALHEKFKTVLAEHADAPGDDRRDAPPQTFSEASVEVDKRARKYQADHKDVDYSDAVRAVLDEDAELKYAYTFGDRR